MEKQSLNQELCNVALCCIAKLENEYIREYIEYYLDLGVDKIIIYDNNDTNGETFNYVIKDYIDKGVVDIIDYKDRKICQLSAYQDCYKNYRDNFDWIMFFDCDEFLKLEKHKNIKDYLSDPKFNDFEIIHINWLIYDDNNLVTKTSGTVN